MAPPLPTITFESMGGGERLAQVRGWIQLRFHLKSLPRTGLSVPSTSIPTLGRTLAELSTV